MRDGTARKLAAGLYAPDEGEPDLELRLRLPEVRHDVLDLRLHPVDVYPHASGGVHQECQVNLTGRV